MTSARSDLEQIASRYPRRALSVAEPPAFETDLFAIRARAARMGINDAGIATIAHQVGIEGVGPQTWMDDLRAMPAGRASRILQRLAEMERERDAEAASSRPPLPDMPERLKRAHAPTEGENP